ncbi:MAG: glycosyl transferase family protein [uncultured bacterium]|nr:MAG: glycosyl transferase family protein [uncultured bacterium]KKP68313.1 MAG: Glycosyl transferase family 2 [Candidatus Moranbacteria bacterium GW2011_GWE1_35_17]KKP70644.1 MAG: Glycosyl transferase family 2 [Candidatus Moranbacteria bacterium GW2011_GWE2_35_164]KKP81843.1 MAG: Glycosyl transferase family 2 [Candidatus Moranbacteria bacterium GW2011_GWF1_35_5]KKP82781.1 MAG: Glycosyl transferase family 2 [Candidatus Moranbacteria bacterium GW2011_GWF2_35_54]
MNSNIKIFVIIPAYNEASVVKSVINEIKNAGYSNIIVVDDGSSDNTFLEAQSIPEVVSLKHFINRGKGAAVKTGIEAAKLLQADIAITIDGDGQHNPEDIRPMIDQIKKGFDVVLGTRLKNPKGMPPWKIAANHFGNFCTWAIYGLWVTDSQSGFRAYSKKALARIKTTTDRYEYDSEVIREISRNKLKYTEIPIEVRYTKYSMSKANKMNLKNGIKTLVKMIIYN